jgi:uncharacterized protein HemX
MRGAFDLETNPGCSREMDQETPLVKRIANFGAAVLVLALGLGASAPAVHAQSAEKIMEKETNAQLDKVEGKVVDEGAAQSADAKAKAAADAKAELEAEKAAAEAKGDK